MLEADPAAEREDRRARAGFVAASSARSFLGLVRQDDVATLLRTPVRDPITRAFFREYEPEALDAGAVSNEAEPSELRELLEAAGGAQAPRLLEAAPGPQPMVQTLLARALAALADRDGALHAERMRELAYLANVLLAGAGSRLRPFDAAEAALATCNRGLEHALAELGQDHQRQGEQARPEDRAVKCLERLGCDILFRVGQRLSSAADQPRDTRAGTHE
jgi:hypothetical protein